MALLGAEEAIWRVILYLPSNGVCHFSFCLAVTYFVEEVQTIVLEVIKLSHVLQNANLGADLLMKGGAHCDVLCMIFDLFSSFL